MIRRPHLLTALTATFVFASLPLLTAGCATTPEASDSPEATAPATAPGTPAAMPACALEIPGTTADLEEIEAGLVVNFRHAGDAAAVLSVQERVEARLAFLKANPKPMPFEISRRAERSSDGIRMIVEVADLANAPMIRAKIGKQIAASQAKAKAAEGNP